MRAESRRTAWGGRIGATARLLARVILGNDAGPRLTVRGRRALRAAQRAARERAPGNEAARALTMQGWARLDDHIPTDVVDHVTAEFARLIHVDRLCVARGEIEPDAHRYLVDPQRHIPAIADLLTPTVREAIEGYYGGPFRVRTIRAFRNFACEHANEATNVFGNTWHVDPHLVCDLRYFVYLSETVTPANGALMSFDRRTSRRLVRTGYLRPGRAVGPAGRALASAERATTHTGCRGFGVLIDPQHCMHRAGTCAPGEQRDAVQFWITPAERPLPPDWGAQLGPDPVFDHGGPTDAG